MTLIPLDNIVLLALVLAAACFDAKKGIIPNKLVLAGFAFLAILMLIEPSWPQALHRFYGFLAGGGSVLLIILMTRGGMGAGDLKLMALIGAFVGARLALSVLLLAVVLAGIYAAVLLALKQTTLKSKLAFAPYIAAALFAVVFFYHIGLS